MCGIAGIYNLHNNVVLIDELKKMTDVISHRGPDGQGHWINDKQNIGFGHRRLSIIDLSENGKQPMHYYNERYTITFNGEIYNYIELKKDLIKKGFQFISDSDTEVLLALYHNKREKCLDDLDGMFSFAIWDEVKGTLFCARDRFGEKPFHYYHNKNQFIFASEIKQFWAIDIEKKLNQEKLIHFTKTGNTEDASNVTETFFNGIEKLEPAHYLIIDADKSITIKRYWDIDLNAEKFNGSIEQAAEKFLELFTNSINIRLRSDVAIGSSLSGGLDSSSIVMLIDALKGKDLKQNTFSARFKDFAKDEGTHIDAVIKACKNMQVHYTWPDKDYFEKVFDTVTYHQDEPYVSASIVAQYAVMELAKQNNVTVLLDGQGADEQLAGYLPYYHLYLNKLFYSNPKLYKTEFKAYQTKHQLACNYKSPADNETWRMKIGRYKKLYLGQPLPNQNDFTNSLKSSTTHTGLTDLLRYADRNSMAQSREVRLPFLSHKLVEFVFSLPDEFKLNDGWTKFVLRKSMTEILPNSICWRVDKIGYDTPQETWFNAEHNKTKINKTAAFLNVDRNKNSTIDFRLLVASKFL